MPRLRPPRLDAGRDRALRLLADAPDGCTEAIMLAHGFTVELMVDLCIAELAIATVECMVVGGRTVELVVSWQRKARPKHVCESQNGEKYQS
jgi:hypothetical protein